MNIPDDFWPLFERKLAALAALYSPVTVPRLLPFLASHLPAKMVEIALMRAVERGLCSFTIIENQRPYGPPEKIRALVRPRSRKRLRWAL